MTRVWVGGQSGDVALLKLSGVEKQSPRKVYEAFATLAEADNIVVTWRHGITTWMVETRGTPWGARLRHMGLRQPYAFSCLLRYLVRPVDRVVQAVKGQLGEVMEGTDGGGGFSVCLSVNPTHEIASDAAAAQASDSVKRIFHCAEVRGQRQNRDSYWQNASFITPLSTCLIPG